MSSPNIALPADTPITIKVTLGDGDCRRIKLALRDLGPNTLPEKLRQLLIIPASQDIVLERYSDSAGAYIILDSNNPSVYKQLYRAAKAKLKLRIKVSIVDPSAPKFHTIDPKLLCTDRLSSNCYVPPTTPVMAKTEFDAHLGAPVNLIPPVGSAAEMPASISSRLAEEQAEHLQRFSTSRSRQELLSSAAYSNCMAPYSMGPVATPVKPAVMGSANAPVTTGAEDGSSPQFFSARDHFYAELANMSKDFPPFLRTADQVISMPGSSFTICCNHCDVAIPNVHWHCSSCDNGDFDLCVDCVNKGILCDSTDHWLIKRFVQNGKVTNSTTERIEPKKAPAVETAVAQEAPAVETTACKSEMLHDAHAKSRTCNSCISVFTEENFFTCTVCEDYDLCTACLIGKKHGHHPNHALAPVSKYTYAGPITSDLCKAGRNVRHRAICDGCDKDIYGVRHKCLDCPDWDFCSHCIKDVGKSHPGHRFAPLWDPLPMVSQRSQRHYGIQCDGPLCTEKGAQAYIMGDRYKCAVCHDTDFCANCEAFPLQRHNRTHPLIKIKTPIKNVSVTTLGEKDNGEQMVTMGDQPPQTSSKSTETTSAITLANAATQFQGMSMAKPSKPIKVQRRVQRIPRAYPSQPQLQAHCVGGTVANGAILAPSTTFTQVWTLLNPGPSKWTAGSSVRFVGGAIMYNVDLQHPSSVSDLERAAKSDPIGHDVEVGEQAEFSVIMKAPTLEGRVVSYWRLMDCEGTTFGPKLECEIQVCYPPQPAVVSEVVTNEVAEPAEEESEAQDDEEKLGSQMIFPKLEKESPVASTHEAESEQPAASESGAELLDDLEDLELGSDDESDGFLTDEEYDLLDMSDAETCVTPHGGN